MPKDLVEAVGELLTYENLDEFKGGDPADYHHTMGGSIRNEWGLWDENSDLHKWFNSIGIYHPDDMSGIILDTTHRILNKKKVDLKDQVESCKAYYEEDDI